MKALTSLLLSHFSISKLITMLKNIYRKEAIEYKKIHWKGKALLLAGIPAWLVTLLASLFLIALVLSLIFCTFTQRIDVRGEVITLPLR